MPNLACKLTLEQLKTITHMVETLKVEIISISVDQDTGSASLFGIERFGTRLDTMIYPDGVRY